MEKYHPMDKLELKGNWNKVEREGKTIIC